MKKAKDYAAKYNANPTSDTIIAIIRELLDEAKELQVSRKVSTRSGIISIMNEQENKWKAICRRTEDLKPSDFRDLIRRSSKDLYEVWTCEGVYEP